MWPPAPTDAVSTCYDPLRDDEPELARTMAASVKQRIAFGEGPEGPAPTPSRQRAGQRIRRIGSGFGDEGERPALTGPRCANVNGFSLHANTQVPAHRRDQFELLEKLAAIVPLPRVHLVRYAGCLAPHSTLREAIIPTPRQQGVDGEEAKTGTPSWSWARLLGRVFALDMATCPFCRHGSLRIIAAITQAEVIRKMLHHLKLAADPPPLAPARARQETFDWAA